MSKVLYYYARLNEHDVCVEFEISTRKDKGHSKLIPLVEQNTSYLYSKYNFDSKSFTQEKFEPSIDTVFQERLESLETENQQLSTQVSSLEPTLQNVNSTNETLIQSIAELTAMIAMLQTS